MPNTNNSIMVKNHHMVRNEAKCSAAVYPGMLIQRDSSNTGQIKPHATSGGNASAKFAIEDELRGRNKSQAYSSGDRVAYVECCHGDVVLCKIANGQTIADGDLLESNGDGYMKKHTAPRDSSTVNETTYHNSIVLEALEAVDMSDSSAADPDGFCKAMVV